MKTLLPVLLIVSIAPATGILASEIMVRPVAPKPDAQACALKRADIEKKEREIEENTNFLGKNRDYLTMLSPDEASKFLKVEGNIMMLLTKIDESKREVARLESELERDGCESDQGENK